MRRFIPRQAPIFSPHPRPVFSIPAAARLLARPTTAHFSTSRLRANEAPRSPWAVFVETLKVEVEKDKALQGDLKQLDGEVGPLKDNKFLKSAGEAYEQARVKMLLENNPKLKKLAENVSSSGGKVSDAVAESLRQVAESETLRRINDALATATAPVRNTQTYKVVAESVGEAFDDSNMLRYGGFAQKEVRRKRRQERLEKLGRLGMGVGSRVKANDEVTGIAKTAETENAKPSGWISRTLANSSAFAPMNRKLDDLKETWAESEDPFVAKTRQISNWFGRMTEENETAKVTRLFRILDPSYHQEEFAKELREYVIPEVLDAYWTMDKEALQAWCGEAAYSILWAGTMEQYLKAKLISESRVVTINNVEIQRGVLTQEELPSLLVTFQTQEIKAFRDMETGELKVGSPDKVIGVGYAVVIGRIEEELEDEVTGGWKILEMLRREM